MKKICSVMVVMWCLGCAGYHPTEMERLGAAGQPRVVNTVVFVESHDQIEHAVELVGKVSKTFSDQVGIHLRVSDARICRFEDRGLQGSMQALVACCDNVTYDIAIGFLSPRIDTVFTTLVGGWAGVIEDKWRRHIVLKRLDHHTLLHEVSHAFILANEHSLTGLMQPISVDLLPGVSLNSSDWLSKKDRDEVLRNKWRIFSSEPVDVR